MFIFKKLTANNCTSRRQVEKAYLEPICAIIDQSITETI